MSSDGKLNDAVRVAHETHKASMRLKDAGKPYCRFSAYQLPTLIAAATSPKQDDIAERLADALDSCLKELWSDRHSNMSEEQFRRELAPEHEALAAYEKQKGRE